MKQMNAEEAAEIIQHDDMVAFSGFTPAVPQKRCPLRLPNEPANSIWPGSPSRSAC
jgi:hypothetical protein